MHLGGSDGGRVRFEPDHSNDGKTIYKLDAFGGFYRSDDTGVSFQQISQNIPGQPGIPPDSAFAIDPANTSRLLLGGESKLFETSDRGNHWEAISGELSSGASITAVAYAPSNDAVIYVAYGDGKVFRTTSDGGPLGTDRQPVDAETPFGSPITNIAVDPLDWKRVYATAGSRVWQTLDSGASPWQDVGGNLPNFFLNALAVYHAVHDADPILMVGNEIGVFASHKPEPGAQWKRYGIGLPEARVKDLEFDTRTLRLTAGTWGRGVFQILIPRILTKVGAPLAFGAYDNPSDGFQHALVATADGMVTEIFFGNPASPGLGRGPLNAQFPLPGLVGVAGYLNPVDGFQHAIAATNDGVVHELRYANRSHPGNFVDPQGPLAHFEPNSIVALAGYFTPTDNFQHAIVATRDGKISEVFFGNPQFPGIGVDVLATFPAGIIGLAGYYNPRDGFQHTLVATSDGVLHEIKFANRSHPGNFVDPQGPLAHFEPNSMVALAGYFTPSDNFQHAIVATRDSKITEIFFGNPQFPGTGMDVLATFDSGTLSGLGAYATTDGFQHVLVLQSGGIVNELRFRPDVGFQTSTS